MSTAGAIRHIGGIFMGNLLTHMYLRTSNCTRRLSKRGHLDASPRLSGTHLCPVTLRTYGSMVRRRNACITLGSGFRSVFGGGKVSKSIVGTNDRSLFRVNCDGGPTHKHVVCAFNVGRAATSGVAAVLRKDRINPAPAFFFSCSMGSLHHSVAYYPFR